MGVQYLEAYGDSKLIINQIKGEQIKGEYEVWHEDLILTLETHMTNYFDYMMFLNLSCYFIL